MRGKTRFAKHKQQLEFIRVAENSSLHIEIVNSSSPPLSKNNWIEIVEGSFRPLFYIEDGPIHFGDNVHQISIDGSQVIRPSWLLDNLGLFPDLKSLEIESVEMNRKQIYIVNTLPNLVGLDLSRTNLSAKDICDNKSLKSLTHLRMDGCRLEFNALLNLVTKCPKLEILDIQEVGIDEKWEEFSRHSFHLTLDQLYLNDAGASYFLANHSIEFHVEHLIITDMNIQDNFLSMLQNIQGVNNIILLNPRGDVQQLALFSQAEGLEHLSIIGVPLSPATVNEILKNKYLRELKIYVKPSKIHFVQKINSRVNLNLIPYSAHE